MLISAWTDLALLSGPISAIGRVMIIHEKEDDGVTQPTGNAGNRFGQCVIGSKNVVGNVASNEATSTKYAVCELKGIVDTLYGRIKFTQNDDVRECNFLTLGNFDC